AEVVRAELDDVESLKKAFAGAHGVYGVTAFWDYFSAAREQSQARNIAAAAKHAGVKHIIWSTLEDTRQYMKADDTRMPMLEGGKYRVPHMDGKDEANAAFQGLPTTFLVTTFYWDNFYAVGLGPKKGADGQYEWTLPVGDAKVAGIAVEDIGNVAYGIFKAGDTYVGKTVGIFGEALTASEMAEKISKVTGLGPIRYNAIEPNDFRRYNTKETDEMGNMFQVFRDFPTEFLAKRSAEVARQLNPRMQNFDEFLAKNRAKMEAAMNAAPAW
ncbi:MAG: NmrA family NAD(P)-binding protein, partial [Chloroflexota bacterium]